ncbi:MAG: ThuA domain-containing protein, partial [Cyclobacteriaceae bacterium]|nr:ThuA domain-containing protein [Cyclobacteriaceae bacterium]
AIRQYLTNGKPLIGTRTAQHAFAALERIEEGFEAWPEFTPDVLGCINRGYGAAEHGTDIYVVPKAEGHQILNGLPSAKWHTKGQAYHIAPLVDRAAVVLLEGTMDGRTDPVAWTRMSGESKVFYTSLGHPADFETPEFLILLTNAIKWALNPAEK